MAEQIFIKFDTEICEHMSILVEIVQQWALYMMTYMFPACGSDWVGNPNQPCGESPEESCVIALLIIHTCARHSSCTNATDFRQL
jgi:hypothetical protein